MKCLIKSQKSFLFQSFQILIYLCLVSFDMILIDNNSIICDLDLFIIV